MKKKQTELSKFLAKKISKNKSETSGVAALTIGDFIYDMVRVDQRYIDGVNFSTPRKDLSSVFKMIKKSNHLNRLVTLSPLTEMAKNFHLRNGAKLVSVNENTQNFEYK